MSDEPITEFPERPGALRNFLMGLQQGWNISLFHYRNHGAGTAVLAKHSPTLIYAIYQTSGKCWLAFKSHPMKPQSLTRFYNDLTTRLWRKLRMKYTNGILEGKNADFPFALFSKEKRMRCWVLDAGEFIDFSRGTHAAIASLTC